MHSPSAGVKESHLSGVVSLSFFSSTLILSHLLQQIPSVTWRSLFCFRLCHDGIIMRPLGFVCQTIVIWKFSQLSSHLATWMSKHYSLSDWEIGAGWSYRPKHKLKHQHYLQAYTEIRRARLLNITSDKFLTYYNYTVLITVNIYKQ